MLKEIHIQWLKICAEIKDELPEKFLKKCPVCGEIAVDFQYVGDAVSRIGCMWIWCNSCKNRIEVSRLKIPENATFMTFDTPKDELTKRIPKFKQV